MNIFANLPVGDSAAWTDTPITLLSGFVVDATAWSLTYFLRGPAAIDIAGTALGVNWGCSISASQSAVYLPGTYSWSAAVAMADQRHTVASGQLTLTPNLATITTAFDPRSTAQIALSDCEKAMSTFNQTGGKVKKYEIAGRSMEFQTIAELMTLHSFWRAKVLGEQSAQSVANGLSNPRNLYVRFVRPQ